MVPPLFSNSRNQQNFRSTITKCIALNGFWLLFFSPICVYAYGDKLRTIVLLNLSYGDFQTFILASYATVMTLAIGLNYMPVHDILVNLKKNSSKNILLENLEILAAILIFLTVLIAFYLQ
jgi:hypothetical protein